jgi:hypothetical protein
MGELVHRSRYTEEIRLVKARAFLKEVFPEASLVQLADVHPAERERLLRAGLDVAEVHIEGSRPLHATFTFCKTAHTDALEAIWLREEAGALPDGSHERAIKSIQNGEFKQEWGSYFPGQAT